MPSVSDGITLPKLQRYERSTSVINVHRIMRGTTLLAVFGFMLIVWAYGTTRTCIDASQFGFGKSCETSIHLREW